MAMKIPKEDQIVQSRAGVTRWDFYVHPFGIPIAQTWPQFFGILALINRHAPDLLIELGIDQGGLGSLLIMRCKYVPDFHYLGIDENEGRINPILKGLAREEPRFAIHIADIYSEETLSMVQSRIAANPGSTAIFCDGGDKLVELQIYSKFLKKKGDILVGHDYTPGLDVPNTINDEKMEFLLEDFDPLDDSFFKHYLILPCFMRK